MTFFRAEKGTANYNAVRVLTAGVLISLLLLQSVDPLYRLWDQHVREKPWVSASLKIVTRASGDDPDILYHIQAPYYVSGNWYSYIESLEGEQLCSSTGEGTYGPDRTERVWHWNAFFKSACKVPAEPFRICVRYDVQTARGVPGEFGPYCSSAYDPRTKRSAL